MVKVTLLSAGGSCWDPETGIRFERGVTHEVDESVAERLKAVEKHGFAFLIGDPAALDIASPPKRTGSKRNRTKPADESPASTAADESTQVAADDAASPE